MLTRTIASGICNGTDMKILHGEFKGINQYPCLLAARRSGKSLLLEKKGEALQERDRVMVPFLETDTDGKYAGYYSFWSGYSEYTVARDYEVMMEEERA